MRQCNIHQTPAKDQEQLPTKSLCLQTLIIPPPHALSSCDPPCHPERLAKDLPACRRLQKADPFSEHGDRHLAVDGIFNAAGKQNQSQFLAGRSETNAIHLTQSTRLRKHHPQGGHIF